MPTSPHADLTAALSEHSCVGLAMVYGSVARDEARPESDVDVAVMGARLLSDAELLGLTRSLSQATGRPVDLVDLRVVHGTLLSEIFRSGVRILERDATLYPALLYRHLVDEADFRPIRDRILNERREAWIGA